MGELKWKGKERKELKKKKKQKIVRENLKAHVWAGRSPSRCSDAVALGRNIDHGEGGEQEEVSAIPSLGQLAREATSKGWHSRGKVDTETAQE